MSSDRKEFRLRRSKRPPWNPRSDATGLLGWFVWLISNGNIPVRKAAARDGASSSQLSARHRTQCIRGARGSGLRKNLFGGTTSL